MGQSHSAPAHHNCDYSNYKNKIKQLQDELTAEQNKNKGETSQVQSVGKNLLLEKAKLDKLASIFAIDQNNRKFTNKDFSIIGKKRSEELTSKYKDTLVIKNLQKELLDIQLKFLSIKDLQLVKIEKRIKKIANSIDKDSRMLEYDEEEESNEFFNISFLKVLATIIIVISILMLVKKIKNKK